MNPMNSISFQHVMELFEGRWKIPGSEKIILGREKISGKKKAPSDLSTEGR